MLFPLKYQRTWRGKPTTRYRVYAYFANGGNAETDSVQMIMAGADCAQDLANRYRNDYLSDQQLQKQPPEAWHAGQPGQQECTKCNILSSYAPVLNGECIYCWMQARQIDVRRFYEETAYTQDELYTWWLAREEIQ